MPEKSLKDEVTDLDRRVDDHEHRFRTIETYAKAAAVVALVFGIGGAWGATVISKAKDAVTTLDTRLTEIDSKTKKLDEQVKTSTGIIETAKTQALAQISAEIPNILRQAKALRHCRVCYNVAPSPGGDGGQCGGDLSGCSPWSDVPDWSAAYNDDSDGRSGWCSMRWKLECE